MSLSSFSSKYVLAVAALLTQPVVYAQPPAPPPTIASAIKAMGLENSKDISFFDENKTAITQEQFDQQLATGKAFSISKQAGEGGAKAVTFSLMNKAEIEAIRKPTYKVKAGDPFPAFSLRRLDGTVIDNAALRSRFTLINFMFADCAPCVKEVPELNAFAKAHPEMNFVAMTFDQDAEAKKFVDTYQFEWKMLPDAQKTIAAAGVKSYPSFALLDPAGAVLAIALHTEFAGKGLAGWVERVKPASVTMVDPITGKEQLVWDSGGTVCEAKYVEPALASGGK